MSFRAYHCMRLGTPYVYCTHFESRTDSRLETPIKHAHFSAVICQPLTTCIYDHGHCVIAATPADVSLMMQLGVDGVFVGSGIFKSSEPARRAAAIVEAVTHYDDPNVLARVSHDLGQPMVSVVVPFVYHQNITHTFR